MTGVITTEEMRALERAAIEGGQVTGLQLMERAGEAVVDAIVAEWPQLEAPRALVLCGPGNNGGDGFVVARLLLEAGWPVSVAATKSLSAMAGDAATNAARWAQFGSDLTPYRAEQLEHQLTAPGSLVVVDALLGIGQTRNCDAILEPFMKARDYWAELSFDNEVVSVSIDVPTGYDTDSGALLATNPFEPDLTVTFHQKKPVHLVLEQQGYKTVVKDIGL